MDEVNEQFEELQKYILKLWETWNANLEFPKFLAEQLHVLYVRGAEYGYNQGRKEERDKMLFWRATSILRSGHSEISKARAIVDLVEEMRPERQDYSDG